MRHARGSGELAVMDEMPRAELTQRAPGLDYNTVMAQYERLPSALDRRLTLLRELLLQQDMPQPTDETKLYRVCRAYAGCRAAAAAWDPESGEEEEFWDHLKKEGWDASGQSIWLSCARVPAHETRKSRGRISGLSFIYSSKAVPAAENLLHRTGISLCAIQDCPSMLIGWTRLSSAPM